MNRTYLRGDMYFADLGRGIGSEQEGYRPVLILQNNTGNKYSPTVIVAAISSKVDAKAKLPTHYLLKAENGLELPSLVLLEQLRTIDKKRLGAYIGRLEEKHIRKINHALAVSVVPMFITTLSQTRMKSRFLAADEYISPKKSNSVGASWLKPSRKIAHLRLSSPPYIMEAQRRQAR